MGVAEKKLSLSVFDKSNINNIYQQNDEIDNNIEELIYDNNIEESIYNNNILEIINIGYSMKRNNLIEFSLMCNYECQLLVYLTIFIGIIIFDIIIYFCDKNLLTEKIFFHNIICILLFIFVVIYNYFIVNLLLNTKFETKFLINFFDIFDKNRHNIISISVIIFSILPIIAPKYNINIIFIIMYIYIFFIIPILYLSKNKNYKYFTIKYVAMKSLLSD